MPKILTDDPSRMEPPAVLTVLRTCFPVLAQNRPLALGIDQAMQRRCPSYSRRRVRTALRLHTRTPAYLAAVARGGVRYDLDGVAVTLITSKHREHAQRLLAQASAQTPATTTATGVPRRPRFGSVLRLNRKSSDSGTV